MKRLVWLIAPALLPACAARFQATVPEPVVTVGVTATPPPPPPEPPPPPPPPEVAAEAPPVDTDGEAIPEGDPEEVLATTEPPDPIYEEETDAPGPGYVWVGGYWGWSGVDWGWSWGRWAPAPPYGEIYIGPYYERVGGSVVYVRGYWGPHDYVRRSYGGQTIRFGVAVRPADYHRGERVVIEHRAGPLPGHRPGGQYVRATGTLRPVPRQTVPRNFTASAHAGVGPRGEPGARGAGPGGGNAAAGQSSGPQGGKKPPATGNVPHPGGGGPPRGGGSPPRGGGSPPRGGGKKH
jgi:hypothetical protein